MLQSMGLQRVGHDLATEQQQMNKYQKLLAPVKVALMVKDLSANAGDIRDMGLTPGSGRSPGVGNDNPLQYSCLENAMHRGAWQATVHGVTKSQT